MDNILLFSSEEQKFQNFLTKLGYDVSLPQSEMPINDLVTKKNHDLIILDTAFSVDAVELCDFLRNNDSTKQVPIICLLKDKVKGYKIRDLGHDKIEMIPSTASVGSIVAKMATQLRMRKIAGENSATATLAETNAALRDLNARFRKEMEQARAIQRSLLPETLPGDERFSMAVHYKPLEEVGGDWYFFNKYPNDGLGMIISDVTGHGLAAAFVGSMTRLALTAAGAREPAQLLKEANRLMSPQLPQGTFVTMCSLCYEPASGKLACSNAGQPPLLVYNRSESAVKQLKAGGFAIGFFEDSEYQEVSVKLEVNDVLLAYTDGITEAQNRSGEQYGVDRLSATLAAIATDATPDQIKEQILNDFKIFCDGRKLKDDITLMILKRVS